MCSMGEDTPSVPWSGRGHWGNRAEFVLLALGLELSSGSFWRYSFYMYRHNLAFFVSHLLMLFAFGIPLFYLETSLAQFSSKTMLKLYDLCPPFRGVSYFSFLCLLFYTVAMGLNVSIPIMYMYYSMAYSELPWHKPDFNISGEEGFSRAEKYVEFYRENIQLLYKDGAPNVAIIIACIIALVLTFALTFKGAKIIGKVSYFTIPTSLALLVILLIKGLTLPGGLNGVAFMLSPRLDNFLEVDCWHGAAQDFIFSLGFGLGPLLFLGSHNRYREDPLRNAFIVPIVSTVLKFLLTLMTGSYLGFIAETHGLSFSDVMSSGKYLLYVSLTQAMSELPHANVWLVLFYLFIFLINFTGFSVHMETIAMSLIDKFNALTGRKTVVSIVLCSVFSVLILVYSLGEINTSFSVLYTIDVMVVMTTTVHLAALVYGYGTGRIMRDIQIMTTKKQSLFWLVMWLVVCPLIMLFVIVWRLVSFFGIYDKLSGLFVLCPIFLYVFWVAEVSKFTYESDAHTPSPLWGPAEPQYREEWVAYCHQMPQGWKKRVTPPSGSLPPVFDNLEMDQFK